MILKSAKKKLAARAEEAIMQQLPVEPKTLRHMSKMLEPKNLKHVGIAALVGTTTFSILTNASHMRAYRTAMAKELRKQLDPVNKKLDELEEQNDELRRQNEQLQKELKSYRK